MELNFHQSKLLKPLKMPCRLKTKREPGLFALLGWETGIILKQISNSGTAGFEDGAVIATALQEISINGPRGELRLDPATNYFTAPLLKCRLHNNNGQMKADQFPFPADAWETFIQLPTDGSASGWTNTYLCY